MSSMSAYLMAGLKSLAAMLTTCAFSLGMAIDDAGMVIVVVVNGVNGVNGVVIIGAIAERSMIFVAFALMVGTTPASTSTDVFSSTFFNPEYLMRGCDFDTVVNSSWYDWLVFAPTVKLAGAVSNDDGNWVAVWKILDGTRVLLVASIDTILLGLKVGVFMTILLYFVGTFNSFVATGIVSAASGFVGDVIDVIDGIVTVTGVAADVAVPAAFCAVFFNLSADSEIHLENRRERILKTNLIFSYCIWLLLH